MKNFIRTISFIVVTVLILSTVLPVSIYASSVITDGENNGTVVGAKTGSEDITMQITPEGELKGSTGDESLNENGIPSGNYIVEIPVVIDAYNSSYIKDASISFANSNFTVVDSKIADNKNVQSINKDVIKLNSSEIDEKIELNIPVSFKKVDYVAEDYFNRAVTVKLEGTYVDKNGTEKTFSKQTQVNISWHVLEKEILAKARIVRSFEFTENNQRNALVTVELTSGIKDGRAPEKEESLEVSVPNINNIHPELRVSTEKYTTEENPFTGKLTLTKNIEKNESNEYKWDKESEKIYVTYIYRGINNNFYSSIGNMQVDFVANIKTVDEADTKTKHARETEIAGTNTPIIVEATATSSINRGAIIADVGIDTDFDVKYLLNIGYAGTTNSITLKENTEASAVKTKSISANANEITRVLGDSGKITVSFTEGTDTYEINKNNTTITIPNGKKIKDITTSKPTGDGNLNIKIVKTVNNSDKEALANKTKITGGATITNTALDNSQTTIACEWETKIEEPTQKIQFESKFKTLSTVKKNERMILSAILESDSVDDYLFKNPAIRITYPSDIKTISNVTVNVLYDDYSELNKNITPRVDNDKHTIVVELSGEQKHYCTSAVSKGILIQIVADYTLDRLAPTKDSEIKLEAYNANTNKTTELKKGIRIVAPTKFIIQNKMEVTNSNNPIGAENVYNEIRETIEEDVEDIILPLYSSAKYIDVYGTVVNNQGTSTDNAIITGNFPSKNTNSYSGTQFNATFDTKVMGEINIDGERKRDANNPNGTYKVYYSKNANEAINSNGWSETLSEDAKSYKIVFLTPFENATKKVFHYKVITPENMTYNEHAKESFAFLYGNGSISGEQYSYLEAKTIGVATKPEADFSVDISVKDYESKQEIKNGDTVREGTYLSLKISITNVSNRNIKDVKVVVDLMQGLNKAKIIENQVTHYGKYGNIEESIGEIKASETKTLNEMLYVDPITDDTEDMYTNMNVEVYENNVLEFVYQNFKNKIENRTISGITISTAEKTDVGINDTFQQIFYIRNLTGSEINNVEIKGTVPKGIEYDEEQNNEIKIDGLTYSYDSNKREYTIKIDKISAYAFTTASINEIAVNFKAIDYGDYVLKTKAYLNNEEMNFNDINITVAGKARNFEVSHTISTPTNQVKDTDTFNFNITIKSHWDSEKIVEFKDDMDDNFVVYEYEILQNGQSLTKHQNVNLIEYNYKMKPEDVAEIRIKCGLKTQSKGTTINLTHSPEAICNNVKITINPITINVTGTGEFVNTNVPEIDGKYSISGKAWLDANNDGRREETEQQVSNVKMQLIDNKTNRVFVDDEGNEKTTTTNTNGEYSFNNIPIGSYIVIAYYDSEKYGCGYYQNRNVAEDLNNDFIETEYEGTIVGTTDNIIIQNTSIYAIDLSLIPRNTFDMALDKNVTSVSITASNGKEANYKYNNEMAKVEISNEKNVKYYFVIEYTLTVKNVGYIDGYVKSVIDYIPKGMTFVQEDNPGWYIKSDGNAYNDTLANTLIKAQNKVDVRIKLRKEMTAEQTGIIKNSAELGDTYNAEGIDDINSKGANKDSSENDYSEALVVVALATGGQIIKVAGIIFGVLALGVVIISIAKSKSKKKII